MNEKKPFLCKPDCPRKASGTCYVNHGCRCVTCKAVNAARNKRNRKKRDPSTLPPEAHGKNSTYRNWNCRCEPCKAAGAAFYADWYRQSREAALAAPPGRPPATPDASPSSVPTQPHRAA